MDPNSREYLLQQRMLEVLGALSIQFPSMSVKVDLWRPKVVSMGVDGYTEINQEVWIRVAEDIPAFYVETMERWFQQEVGVINQNVNYVILSAGYDLDPDDHIMLNGQPWMVVEAAEQAGIAKLKVDRKKSRFRMPARGVPTYREMAMKVKIA